MASRMRYLAGTSASTSHAVELVQSLLEPSCQMTMKQDEVQNPEDEVDERHDAPLEGVASQDDSREDGIL
jgi:hypothetical protein